MLRRTMVRSIAAAITIIMAMAAEGRSAREASCDDLGAPLYVCNEATCAQTDPWTMEVSCWMNAQNTAILQEEWEWYEENCVLDYECNPGTGPNCSAPLDESHVECWWHH